MRKKAAADTMRANRISNTSFNIEWGILHFALIMTSGIASLFYTTNLLGLHHHSHSLFFNLLTASFYSE